MWEILWPGRELPHLAFSRALGSSLSTILLRKAECPVSRVRRHASLCLYLQEGLHRKQEQNQEQNQEQDKEQEHVVPDGLGLRCGVGVGLLHTQDLPQVPGSQHLDQCCYLGDSYRPWPVLLQYLATTV